MRRKCELTALVLFVTGMMAWGMGPCDGHYNECRERLADWMMLWWSGVGIAVTYVIWTFSLKK